MTFPLLAVICAAALLGPLLALPRQWRVPIVVGELVAGILIGRSGMNLVDPAEPAFVFLADVGFALVMFVAGSHVPVRDTSLRASLSAAAVRQAAVTVLAAVAGIGVALLFGTGQAPLYAVLMASSSAAMVLPIVTSLGLRGPRILATMAQVALADVVAIVALPLAMDPSAAGRTALGVAAVLAGAGVVYLVLREGERRGTQQRIHRVSEKRKFALELRLQLVVLFTLSGVAVWGHVSIMLVGFSFGLAVAAVGEPRRLARQLFAITEGFLGPLFFVWLGASLQLQAFGGHPRMIVLGLFLGLGALAVHACMRLLGQDLALGLLAASQLGVPVAAATIGIQQGLLAPGEPAALVLGALVTIAVATVAAGRYGAHGHLPDAGT
ncbi:Kef-type K+ transport system membrane component KefB [Arthrobacter stackebrandtii]|uniref:Kef-type K+ transport system membrane component KefB n=1 Tax=Arthrobacter stackebrandtii TaxID=272161 RepID=A0ABS4Z3J9_9MICC|nr:cation:proton antiporter [Arthrobacter stackebrandtii]MBP2414823.1 Kef-type K+ transport system membrane component KefB [Arthrobacter stackebrandtii]PYG99482.1 sodium:proton antiporter [Arthrobacter stackebrandtii]